MNSILSAVISAYLFHLFKGDTFCSKTKTNVECLPCSDICENANKTCAENKLHSCPWNCDSQKRCNHVCCEFCRDDRCEYTKDGQVKCSEGCFQGSTGICCLEPCPTGCKECNQLNSSCSLCHDGMTGEYCNETIADISTLCPSQSPRCQEELTTCCSETSTYYPTSAGNPYIAPLASGLGSVLFVIICISVFYKISMMYTCNRRVTGPNNSEHSLSTEHGYNYIDETALDPYYSHLKQQNRPKDIYGCIGQRNTLKENSPGNSLHSSTSSSLFGNLFDTSVESEVVHMDVPQDNDRITDCVCVSSDGNEKYLTPTSP